MMTEVVVIADEEEQQVARPATVICRLLVLDACCTMALCVLPTLIMGMFIALWLFYANML